MCTSSVSNVIYHKFSRSAAFYTLNGKNVNVMLEWKNKEFNPLIIPVTPYYLEHCPLSHLDYPLPAVYEYGELYVLYLFGCGEGGDPFQNNPKNIDPPYKKTT